MKRLRSRKFCAALVIIAWLATLVSFWGMLEAGRRAVTSPTASTPEGLACTPKDLRGLGLELEMAPLADDALKILNGDATKAACLRSGMAAQVCADYLFLVSYSGLVLALFLFLRTFWMAPPRERRSVAWGLLALGLLLAAAMAIGDAVENLQLTSMIQHAERNLPLPDAAFACLGLAGHLKWGALAASAFLLALAWTSKTSSRLVWVVRLLGFAAAALLLTGLVRADSEIMGSGMVALFAFWLAALIHAVAVAVATESIQPVGATPEGTRQP